MLYILHNFFYHQTDADLTTKLTIIGNETGGQASINVTSSKLIVETTTN